MKNLWLQYYLFLRNRVYKFTVVIEVFQVHNAGTVPEVNEGLTVGPALNDDTTSLWVEREQCSVQVAGCFHHSTKPPPYLTSVIDVYAKQLEVILVVELPRAVYNRHTIGMQGSKNKRLKSHKIHKGVPNDMPTSKEGEGEWRGAGRGGGS